MKTLHAKDTWLPSILILTIVAACGADTKSRNTDSEQRPPLKLNIDRKPIDRNATERVSYAAIVEKTAPSVVFRRI